MVSTHSLIQDFAVVVCAAASAAVLAPKLRLPVLPAYLLTGVGLGVLYRLRPDILGDVAAVESLSNLGVTFLMFSIGLEFDFAKARALLAPALLAVVFQSLLMFALGSAAASVMGLGGKEALFLGGLLSISSTMVSVATLRDAAHMERNYARLTLGVLIFEDIAAVALLALLAGLGAGVAAHHGAAKSTDASIASTLFFVGAFMTLLLAGGRLLLRRWLPTMNLEKRPEALAVVVGGLVLGTGLVAERFEYSPALGAFVLGAALAQSRVAKSVGETAEPLRHIFSAVFFVTLGVSVKPEALLEAAPIIVPLTVLLIAGKIITCWLGAFLGGQRPDSGLRMALNKAHIGEFSFVIAAMGEHAGVTGPRVTAVAAGCALLSILAHRPLAHGTERIIATFGRRIPPTLKQTAAFYSNLLTTAAGHFDRAMLWKLLRRPLSKSTFHLVFFFSLIGVAHLVCRQWPTSETGTLPVWLAPTVWLTAALLALPFAVALTRNLEAMLMILTETALPRHTGNARGARTLGLVTNLLQFGVVTLLGLALLAFATPWLPGSVAPVLLLAILALAAWLFRHALAKAQSRFELLFIESFNRAAREDETGRRAAELHKMVRRHKWPLHLREHKVAAGTRASGVKLAALSLREATGVFVTAIQREGVTVFGPDPETPIFPGDELMLLGGQEQLALAVARLSEPTTHHSDSGEGFLMDQVFVAHDAPFTGETLAGARLRRAYGVTIAGIQRGDVQHLSPGPDFLIKSGDILLVAGRIDDVLLFKKTAAGSLGGA